MVKNFFDITFPYQLGFEVRSELSDSTAAIVQLEKNKRQKSWPDCRLERAKPRPYNPRLVTGLKINSLGNHQENPFGYASRSK